MRKKFDLNQVVMIVFFAVALSFMFHSDLAHFMNELTVYVWNPYQNYIFVSMMLLLAGMFLVIGIKIWQENRDFWRWHDESHYGVYRRFRDMIQREKKVKRR